MGLGSSNKIPVPQPLLALPPSPVAPFLVPPALVSPSLCVRGGGVSCVVSVVIFQSPISSELGSSERSALGSSNKIPCHNSLSLSLSRIAPPFSFSLTCWV